MTNTAQNAARRDFEDKVLDGQIRPTFGKQYLIDAVTEYRNAEKLTWSQAIEGICEGHELPCYQEAFLLEHFRVQS